MRSVADRLQEIIGTTPQKVIVARSGLGSDQVSKILSGETKDPRWSTMVQLVRDGLGASLDVFAGGGAARPLTPYDANPRYRALVDGLEALAKRDREMVLEFLEWALANHSSRSGARRDAPAEREESAPMTTADIELMLAAPPAAGSLSAPVSIRSPFDPPSPRRKGEDKK